MTLVLYLGGARSGKSRLAVERAGASGSPVTFIATGEAGDDEMAARIELHKRERPPEWRTVEEPLDLAGALSSVPDGDTAVVDCLSLWVANGGGDDAALEAAAARNALTIAVSNEVGMGIVPVNALAREYRDVLGRVNAAWAAAADEAWFVVAGKTLRLS
ncbi:MAG TPA: bifunctional adenosylcobinamide kinase/adenosylcobinamide-phosphate guanylyltransferase [Gaiellaceae bacterium]|nr:bifunctional adenosylcobinamide kinase/adenosylcobinamide-phosphate guanylyltransferase [Gaiellaceae bacterium]